MEPRSLADTRRIPILAARKQHAHDIDPHTSGISNCPCVCVPPAAQVGSGWLNPTEEGVWPLPEALAVARLAFQGLDANREQGQEANDDDGMCAFIPTFCLHHSMGSNEAEYLVFQLTATKVVHCRLFVPRRTMCHDVP